MARAFIDEFARMGWDGARILAMFHTPFFRGPHLAREQLGEAAIRRMIEERFAGRP